MKVPMLPEREELITTLINQEFPPDLAPRAVDAFITLSAECEVFSEAAAREKFVSYGFFQGFVAGAMAAAHHN